MYLHTPGWNCNSFDFLYIFITQVIFPIKNVGGVPGNFFRALKCCIRCIYNNTTATHSATINGHAINEKIIFETI